MLRLFIFLFAFSAFAQNGDRLDRQVQEVEQEIQHWSNLAWWNLATTIAIAAFGATVTAIQGVEKLWSKNITRILGVGVAIFTAVSANYFPADYRALRNAAKIGEKILSDMESLREDIRGLNEGEARTIALAEFTAKKGAFDALQGKLLNMTAGLDLLESVHAQSAPAWVKSPPYSGKTLFFVGFGVGATWVEARQNSWNNAVQTAAHALSRGNASKIPAIAAFVAKAAAVEDTYSVRDPKTRAHRFHTLLRISAGVNDVPFR